MDCLIVPLVWSISTAAIYILVTINLLTAITSIFINYCFIAGILSKRQLITPTNLFVMSLAVSDLLVGLITQPMICAHLLANRVTVRNCEIIYVFFYSLGIFCGASGNCLPVISLDRYMHIKKLQHYTQYVTIKRVVIVIVAVWISSVVTAFLPLYGVSYFHFFLIIIVCHIINAIVMSLAYALMISQLAKAQIKVRPIVKQPALISTNVNSGTTTAATAGAPRGNATATTFMDVPVTQIVTPRATTFTSLNSATTTVAATGVRTDDPASKAERRLAKDISRQLRITVTVAMLVAVVVVSWMPGFISCLVMSLDPPSFDKDATKVTAHYFALTLGLVTSSVNPLLYCWRIKKVRHAALEIFRKTFMFKVYFRGKNVVA